MGETTKAVRVARRAVETLLDVRGGEVVLVIADESGMAENGEIVDAVVGLSRDTGAEANLLVVEDAERGVEAVPDVAEEAMGSADVLIGITKTTAASVIHNPVPERLQEEGKLRRLYMVKRSFEALTSPNVLKADYGGMIELAERVRDVVEGKDRIRVTSEAGTEFTASIEGARWKNNDLAHEAGRYTGISWGEVNTAPEVGTAEGTLVVDGPVLEYGWPSPPLEMEVENGEVVDVSGDEYVAAELRDLIEENRNAENVAELAFGLNDRADLRETNVWKKGRGRFHTAIGNGTSYGQPVSSPVHLDLVVNEPTVRVDDTTVIEGGEFTVG